MKAFVIKNKEGKYYKRGFSCWENIERDGVFNTGHFYYDNKEEAESCIASYDLEDCAPVEITIAEGDLEQQIRKQVCDKIRIALTSIEPNCSIEDMNSNLYEFTGRDIYAILEQIEQSKESMK